MLASACTPGHTPGFISVLSGVDPSFPMELWDRLVPQMVITLNLLRTARATPTTSAYHYVNGAFDYNRTPLAPLGCKVLMQNNENICRSWDVCSLTGWYLGASREHYRCHIIFYQKTRAERVSGSVAFQHQHIMSHLQMSLAALCKASVTKSEAQTQYFLSTKRKYH